MRREPFNDDWQVRPSTELFDAYLTSGQGQQVRLPHDARLAAGRSPDSCDGAAAGYYRCGRWTYTRTLSAPEEWASQRLVLEFEAVYRSAHVYVNGQLAGQREHGYTRFFVPLHDLLEYGQDNTITVETVAGRDSRWYSGAGIIRPVHLLSSGLVHMDPAGPRVTTLNADDELASLEIEVPLLNETAGRRPVRVSVTVTDADGQAVAAADAPITLLPDERASVRLRVHLPRPRRWNLDDPYLYRVTVQAIGPEVRDAASCNFGIRTISVDPVRGFRLNGRELTMRGACIHHDNGILGATTFPAAEERRVRGLRAAGFNAIRSAHNPLSIAMLDACDRLGMLVMDEFADQWTKPKTPDDYAQHFEQWWAADIDSMVAKDYNHPCVVMYSIGNEIPDQSASATARVARRLVDRIRRQDTTRPITNAMNVMIALGERLPELAGAMLPNVDHDVAFNELLADKHEGMAQLTSRPAVRDMIAECNSSLDVVGLNYAESGYPALHSDHPNQVLVGSETFPARIGALWPQVAATPYVIGDFTWTGWDYLGEAGLGRPRYPGESDGFCGKYPWLTAWCGDIDIIGTRRPVSYYREIVFGLRQRPYAAVRAPGHRNHEVQPHAWTWSDSTPSWTWNIPSGTRVTVEAYADADEVEFLVNDESVAVVPVGQQLACFASAELAYQPGRLEVVARRAGLEVGRDTLRTTGPVQALRLVAEQSHLSPDDGALGYLRIELVDARGDVVPTADLPIQVRVQGPGVLQGLGAARPCTEDSFLADHCRCFQGRALAAVRPVGPGVIAVEVNCPGLAPQGAEFQVS